MTSALARRFKLDVSVDNVNWVPFNGIQDLSPVEKPTIQSVADYDSNGFDSKEKTLTSWTVTVKARRPTKSGVFDPGQELVRACQFQFGDEARIYVRWYDRNGAPEAWSGYAIVTWAESKTANADAEEVTATFEGDLTLSAISNPSTVPAVPVITSATPSGQGSGAMVRIQGAYFTGVTASQVKFGSAAAASIDQVSDSLIEAVLPTGSAGSASIVVTNSAGASTAYPYTRAA